MNEWLMDKVRLRGREGGDRSLNGCGLMWSKVESEGGSENVKGQEVVGD